MMVVHSIVGSYTADLTCGKKEKQAHITAQAPSKWQPARGKDTWFALAQEGKSLDIEVSFKNDTNKGEGEEIFDAEEFLISSVLCFKIPEKMVVIISIYMAYSLEVKSTQQ